MLYAVHYNVVTGEVSTPYVFYVHIKRLSILAYGVRSITHLEILGLDAGRYPLLRPCIRQRTRAEQPYGQIPATASQPSSIWRRVQWVDSLVSSLQTSQYHPVNRRLGTKGPLGARN